MNRIYPWADEATAAEQAGSLYPDSNGLAQTDVLAESSSCSAWPLLDQSRECDQALFTPLHYEEGYAYPLVLWMHGPASNENELHQVLPLISSRNYAGVAPRGVSPDRRGFRWRQTERDIAMAEERVFDALDAAAQQLNISETSIYLAGFQCGGTMALRVGLRHPEFFAGVLSIGGALPRGHSPLIRLGALSGFEVLIGYGHDSQKYPEDHVCRDLRLLHSAGASVELRQYPCGDELTTQMLLDMDGWMMERVTSGQCG